MSGLFCDPVVDVLSLVVLGSIYAAGVLVDKISAARRAIDDSRKVLDR